MKKACLLFAFLHLFVFTIDAQALFPRMPFETNPALSSPSSSLLSEVWSPKAEGLLPAEFNIADISVVDEQTIWAVAFDYHLLPGPIPATFLPKVLRSTDGGETWTVNDITAAQGRITWDIHAIDENTACITSQNLSGMPGGKGIFRTTDGGSNWTEVFGNVAGGSLLHFFDAQEGVCWNWGWGGKAVARTTDGGATWAPVPPGNVPSPTSDEGHTYSSASNGFANFGDKIWFGTTKGRILKTEDRGKTWTVNNTGLGGQSALQSMGFIDEKNGLAISWLTNAPTYEIVRSTDGGKIWVHTGHFGFFEVDAIPCANSFIAMNYWTNQSTSVSFDHGVTWTEVDSTIDAAAAVFTTPEYGWMIEAAQPGVGTGPALYKWIGDRLDTRIYVNQNATGANNGKGWANAYTDLKTALTAAQAGDEIWVAAGVYKPADTGGSQNATFTINKNLAVYGGFSGSECYLHERNIALNPTVLSGDLNGNDVEDDFSAATRSDNVLHVVSITTAASVGTVLDGFIIEGGHTDSGTTNGGGINCQGAPAIRNCIFRQNYCIGSGAGIFVSAFGAQGFSMENCRFDKNMASSTAGSAGGGGMSVQNVKGPGFTISGCTFDGNKADWIGGLDVENSNGLVEGTTFTGNSTPRHGGGLRIRYQQGHNNLFFKVRDCLFENNLAAFGGGVYTLLSSQNCSIEVSKTEFRGNVAQTPMLSGWDNSYGGFGAYLINTATNTTISIDSCFFEGNKSSSYYAALGVETEAPGLTAEVRNCTFKENITTVYSSTAGILPFGPNGTVNALVENCLFENNEAVYTAGLGIGAVETQGDFVVRNCHFLNNKAKQGSALTLYGDPGSNAGFVVEDCVLENNKADEDGALTLLASSPLFKAHIDRCIIRNNESSAGGAISALCDDPATFPLTPVSPDFVIANSLIEGNTGGPSVAVDSVLGIRLINCTVANNHGGIQLSDFGSIILQNTILNNPGYSEYQAITNNVTFTSNGSNIIGDNSLDGLLLPSDKPQTDPLFAGPGDYQLTAASPGVDAGNNNGVTSATDLAGAARIQGSRVDIGAYESGFTPVREAFAGEVMTWPNPATAFLNLRLPEGVSGPYFTEVLDANGRLVSVQNPGEGHKLDIQNLAPGDYTLKVRAGKKVYAGQFVKL